MTKLNVSVCVDEIIKLVAENSELRYAVCRRCGTPQEPEPGDYDRCEGCKLPPHLCECAEPNQPEAKLMRLEDIAWWGAWFAKRSNTTVEIKSPYHLCDTARAAHKLAAENAECWKHRQLQFDENAELVGANAELHERLAKLEAQLAEAVEVIRYADNNLLRNHPVWQKCDDFLAKHTDEVGSGR